MVIDIAGEEFFASGLMVTERNWLDVYPYEKWTGSIIGHYEIGETFQPSTLELRDGYTQPPPLLSEADLVALMDKHGIGTDATMHEHIKKIITREYASKDSDMRIRPTPLVRLRYLQCPLALSSDAEKIDHIGPVTKQCGRVESLCLSPLAASPNIFLSLLMLSFCS